MNFWCVSSSGALNNSGTIPAIIFCKLSTAKHIFLHKGQGIAFTRLILKKKTQTLIMKSQRPVNKVG